MRNTDRGRSHLEGSLVVRPRTAFNGVKVFTATQHHPRNDLGGKVTEWLAANPDAVPVEFVIRQSSDAAFHCVTIVLFYSEPAPC